MSEEVYLLVYCDEELLVVDDNGVDLICYDFNYQQIKLPKMEFHNQVELHYVKNFSEYGKNHVKNSFELYEKEKNKNK